MTLTDALTAQLVEHEGLRLRAYQDHLGYFTVGVGHLIDPRKHGDERFPANTSTVITRQLALELLGEDIAKVQRQIEASLPWTDTLDDLRLRVLIDMAFQMGITGLLAFRNTLRAVKEGRWSDAAAGMRASKWASQTPKRAQKLAGWMETGREA